MGGGGGSIVMEFPENKDDTNEGPRESQQK